MPRPVPPHVTLALREIREAGLWKGERVLHSAQQAHITVEGGTRVLNMCANNYLGLANHPEVLAAAQAGIEEHGFGLASVRFICGTQDIHRRLEGQLSRYLGTEDTILYSSCFDANGGLFETILGPEDAVVSDALNHASMIDGIRLCKARRYRYEHDDLDDLAAKLREANAAGARCKLITTDGVFSMDGHIARLAEICDLADRHGALVHFDDCHATGFLGRTGRGTHEFRGVLDRIDLTTGTFGKALGGASGGYTSGKKELIELLRQRSRPYLFSNSLAPPIVLGSAKALEIATRSTELRDRLADNTAYFRGLMRDANFDVLSGEHPIVPIMFGDASLATRMADQLLTQGLYVIGFSYPVVPLGQARIRTQVSAVHTRDDLDFAAAQFRIAREKVSA